MPPYIVLNESDFHQYTGICIDLLDEISDRLGYTYETVTHTGGYGEFINGSWTGATKLLQDKVRFHVIHLSSVAAYITIC